MRNIKAKQNKSFVSGQGFSQKVMWRCFFPLILGIQIQLLLALGTFGLSWKLLHHLVHDHSYVSSLPPLSGTLIYIRDRQIPSVCQCGEFFSSGFSVHFCCYFGKCNHHKYSRLAPHDILCVRPVCLLIFLFHYILYN